MQEANEADLKPVERSPADKASESFVGLWRHLVSTTNWEKGHIIHEWREALIAADAPAAEYSDDAWGSRVGGITSQHVGRLRRVYERFGEVRESYDGLYWSHFQAALDWDDAEMWLEGALQNGWPISRMRDQRWETLGAPEDLKPNPSDVITTEVNEDIDEKELSGETSTRSGPLEEVQGPAGESDEDDEDAGESMGDSETGDLGTQDTVASAAPSTAPAAGPFADLPELPDDLQEALDSFKLAILHHKVDRWTETSREDVLAVLEALRQLALAPAEAS